jgi:hypothetical protein
MFADFCSQNAVVDRKANLPSSEAKQQVLLTDNTAAARLVPGTKASKLLALPAALWYNEEKGGVFDEIYNFRNSLCCSHSYCAVLYFETYAQRT